MSQVFNLHGFAREGGRGPDHPHPLQTEGGVWNTPPTDFSKKKKYAKRNFGTRIKAEKGAPGKKIAHGEEGPTRPPPLWEVQTIPPPSSCPGTESPVRGGGGHRAHSGGGGGGGRGSGVAGPEAVALQLPVTHRWAVDALASVPAPCNVPASHSGLRGVHPQGTVLLGVCPPPPHSLAWPKGGTFVQEIAAAQRKRRRASPGGSPSCVLSAVFGLSRMASSGTG